MPSLSLKKTTLDRLEKYAKASGKTVSAVVDQAVRYWYENHGEIVYQELMKPDGPQLVKNRKA